MSDDFGTRLQYALRLKGIKQKELAEMTGFTQVAISRYINNQRVPDVLFIRRVVEELKVDAAFLLGISECTGMFPLYSDYAKNAVAKKSAKYKIVRSKDDMTLYITDEARAKFLDEVFSFNEDAIVERK